MGSVTFCCWPQWRCDQHELLHTCVNDDVILGHLPTDRAQRKRQQIENILHHVKQFAPKSGDVIVDFCAGGVSTLEMYFSFVMFISYFCQLYFVNYILSTIFYFCYLHKLALNTVWWMCGHFLSLCLLRVGTFRNSDSVQPATVQGKDSDWD